MWTCASGWCSVLAMHLTQVEFSTFPELHDVVVRSAKLGNLEQSNNEEEA